MTTIQLERTIIKHNREVIRANTKVIYDIINGNNNEGFRESKTDIIVTTGNDIWHNIEPEDYDELKKRHSKKFKNMKEDSIKKLAAVISFGVNSESEWSKISLILQLKKKPTIYNSVTGDTSILTGYR